MGACTLLCGNNSGVFLDEFRILSRIVLVDGIADRFGAGAGIVRAHSSGAPLEGVVKNAGVWATHDPGQKEGVWLLLTRILF